MTVLSHPMSSARPSSADGDNHSAHSRDTLFMGVQERWSPAARRCPRAPYCRLRGLSFGCRFRPVLLLRSCSSWGGFEEGAGRGVAVHAESLMLSRSLQPTT